MALIHCTKKLQKAVGIKTLSPAVEPQDSLLLGSWHANIIQIENCHCLMFANDKTLFNFLIADIPIRTEQQLAEQFRLSLRCILASEGFDAAITDKLMSEYADINFANTTNRRVLGSMNELAFMYACHFEEKGSIHGYMLPEIIYKMNRVIMGMLNGKYPIEALRYLCLNL